MYKVITVLIVGVLAINVAAMEMQNGREIINHNERSISNSWNKIKSTIPNDIMTCIESMLNSIKEIMPQPLTNAIKHILLDLRIIKAFIPMALNQFIEDTIINFINILPKIITSMENSIRIASTSMEQQRHISNIREHIIMILSKLMPMVKTFGSTTTTTTIAN